MGSVAEVPLTRLYKNNSDLVEKKGGREIARCPNSGFYGRVVVELGEGLWDEKLFFVRCKMWGCPFCAKVNASVLRFRVQKGVSAMYDRLVGRVGFKVEYWFKFLTLTLPGSFYRSEHTPDQGEADLKRSFSKLVTSLRRDGREFEYLWVQEWVNGYPHLHVLLIGPGIAGKDVLGRIENLWRSRYGMGFVKIKKLSKGLSGLVWYLTKYMTKGLEAGMKGRRVYSASRLFGELMKSDKLRYTVVEFGTFTQDVDGYHFHPMYKVPGCGSLELLKGEVAFEKFCDQVSDCFEVKAFKQMELFE